MQELITGHARFTKDQIVDKGIEIYNRQLRSKLESENIGKFLIIDIETGDYEMDDDDVLAYKRAMTKHPDGARFGMRIGYRVSGTIGNAISGARS